MSRTPTAVAQRRIQARSGLLRLKLFRHSLGQSAAPRSAAATVAAAASDGALPSASCACRFIL